MSISVTKLASALFAALLFAGCPGEEIDPIVASWESADTIGSQRNKLELDEQLQGEARIRAYSGETLLEIDFDVTAVARGGGRYVLDMECAEGACSAFDFKMSCTMSAGQDEMRCDAEGLWAKYAFEWRLE
jgi:hypothetical protein